MFKNWSRPAGSRPQVAQTAEVRMEKEAMDAIVCHSEQKGCKW
jgi:hypothetical protein